MRQVVCGLSLESVDRKLFHRQNKDVVIRRIDFKAKLKFMIPIVNELLR